MVVICAYQKALDDTINTLKKISSPLTPIIDMMLDIINSVITIS